MIEVHSIPVGFFQTNCHILHHPERKEIVVVDPGDEASILIEFIEKLDGDLVEIWNTHGHFDHINANAELIEKYRAPLSIHELEADWLQSADKCLASMAGLPFKPSKADRIWKGGDEFEALGEKWRVYHNPGHSPGSCSIVCDAQNIMMAGDFLMQGTLGRCDLPMGNEQDMIRSMRALFNDWGKDSWRVYSGHTPMTTIGRERVANDLVNSLIQ